MSGRHGGAVHRLPASIFSAVFGVGTAGLLLLVSMLATGLPLLRACVATYTQTADPAMRQVALLAGLIAVQWILVSTLLILTAGALAQRSVLGWLVGCGLGAAAIVCNALLGQYPFPSWGPLLAVAMLMGGLLSPRAMAECGVQRLPTPLRMLIPVALGVALGWALSAMWVHVDSIDEMLPGLVSVAEHDTAA